MFTPKLVEFDGETAEMCCPPCGGIAPVDLLGLYVSTGYDLI
jgi:hypothetical protein